MRIGWPHAGEFTVFEKNLVIRLPVLIHPLFRKLSCLVAVIVGTDVDCDELFVIIQLIDTSQEGGQDVCLFRAGMARETVLLRTSRHDTVSFPFGIGLDYIP